MKIYTKSGDKGKTSLFSGKRVEKYNLSIQAYGTLDELNSWIGLIKDVLPQNTDINFVEIQETLFTLGSYLATGGDEKMIEKLPVLSASPITSLEEAIDEFQSDLPEMKNFILPGGHVNSSYCHVARCVCRRAERLVVELSESIHVDPIIVMYLNRLSDFLFVLSRKVLHDENKHKNKLTRNTEVILPTVDLEVKKGFP